MSSAWETMCALCVFMCKLHSDTSLFKQKGEPKYNNINDGIYRCCMPIAFSKQERRLCQNGNRNINKYKYKWKIYSSIFQ